MKIGHTFHPLGRRAPASGAYPAAQFLKINVPVSVNVQRPEQPGANRRRHRRTNQLA